MRTNTQGWKLYAGTLLLEGIGALARFAVVWATFKVIAFVVRLAGGIVNITSRGTGGVGIAQFAYLIDVLGTIIAVVVALLPLILSIAALRASASGFFLTRWSFGARDLSKREQERLRLARSTVAQYKPNTAAPSAYYMIDQVTPATTSLGTTLFLTTAVIQQDFFTALFARELYHIQSGTARFRLALRSLVSSWSQIFPSGTERGAASGMVNSIARGSVEGAAVFGAIGVAGALSTLARGGIGLWLLKPLWAQYFQEEEYEADQFAAECGQAGPLIEYLEQYEAKFDKAVPYYLSEKPYVELRLDRLRDYLALGAPQPVALPDLADVQQQVEAEQTQHSRRPLGIPSRKGNYIGFIIVGLIVLGVVVFFVVQISVTSARSNPEGGWRLVERCGSNSCEFSHREGPPTSFRILLSIGGLSRDEFHLSAIRDPFGNPNGASAAGSQGKWVKIGDSIQFVELRRDGYDNPISLNREYQIIRTEEEMILRSSTHAYRFLSNQYYDILKEKLVGKWRNNTNGDIYELTLEEGLLINGTNVGRYTVIDAKYFEEEINTESRKTVYEYSVTDTTLTLHNISSLSEPKTLSFTKV